MLKYTDEYLADLCEIRDLIPEIEMLKNKSVLITGAGGLICSAVVDCLMQLNREFNFHIEVYAAGRNRRKIEKRFEYWMSESTFHFFQYDASESLNTEKSFDYVIHGASNANPGVYLVQPVETMLANFIGMNNLLEHIKKTGRGRVLYISSSEVYGKKNTGEAYDEMDYNFVDILNPRACYPSSKRASETLCASYKKEYGIDYVIVRPGHVYGPTMIASDNRASSQFPRDVKVGKDIIMKSKGTQIRSYCYVLDCVSAIITVLLKGKRGEAYNISNKESVVTIREIAEAFAKTAGQKVVFEMATSDEISSFNLMDNSSLTSEKLEALGWEGKFDLWKGVQRTLDTIE